MIENQVRALKLNAKNINTILTKKNTEYRNVKLKKTRLLQKFQNNYIKTEKEKKIESPVKNIASSITSKILSGPMSLFDRVMNFAGVLLLGFIINKLPAIITRIRTFFDNNPWIIPAIKTLFEMIGNAAMGFMSMVNTFKSFSSASIKKSKELINEIKAKVGEIGIFAAGIESTVDGLFSSWSSWLKPEPYYGPGGDPSGSGKGQAQQGNRPALLPKPRTSSSSTGSTSQYSGGPNRSGRPVTVTPAAQTPAAPAVPPAPKSTPSSTRESSEWWGSESPFSSTNPSASEWNFGQYAKGGTVKRPTSSRETGSDKASSDIGYFEQFKSASMDYQYLTDSQEDFQVNFRKMTENFEQLKKLEQPKTLAELLKILRPNARTTSDELPQRPEYQLPGEGTTPIATSGVVGTVGSTGRSEAPHIHIEDFNRPGGSIPDDFVKNIMVGGVPIDPEKHLTSGIGMRWGKAHQGEDYDYGWLDKPITLSNKVKFLRYIPMGTDATFDGYGNVVVVEYGGRTFFLAHLNSGPANLKELLKKQNEEFQKQQQQQQNSGLQVNVPVMNKAGTMMASNIEVLNKGREIDEEPEETIILATIKQINYVPFPIPMSSQLT